MASQVQVMSSMTVETTEAFRRVIQRALEVEKTVERLRQDHGAREIQTLQASGISTGVNPALKWSKQKAFLQMDWLQRGFITQNEISQAVDQLAEPGIAKDKDDYEMLVKRMNKDKTHGRVSMKEFIDELTPKCPTKVYY